MLHPQPHTGSDSELDDSMQTNDNDNAEDNDDKGIEDSPNSRWTSNEVETLKFYPCGWWVVITRAKQYWCLYIATDKTPFLTALSIYQMLQCFLLGLLKNTGRRMVCILESGSFLLCFLSSLILIVINHVCIEYHKNWHMNILASFLLFFSVK